MSYYNTTNKIGGDLKLYEDKAKTQEEKILDIFKSGGSKSPSWIY